MCLNEVSDADDHLPLAGAEPLRWEGDAALSWSSGCDRWQRSTRSRQASPTLWLQTTHPLSHRGHHRNPCLAIPKRV